MEEVKVRDKRRNASGFVYFLVIAAVTTLAVVITITEGNRIRVENELLSYEVW